MQLDNDQQAGDLINTNWTAYNFLNEGKMAVLSHLERPTGVVKENATQPNTPKPRDKVIHKVVALQAGSGLRCTICDAGRATDRFARP